MVKEVSTNIELICYKKIFLVHAKVNSSAPSGIELEELINNSTFIPFRFKEVKKVLKIRVVPQGPFYVTISSTKGIVNGTVLMEFSKSYFKYKLFEEVIEEKNFAESFAYEDTNDITLVLKNSGLKVKKGLSLLATLQSNLTNSFFIGLSSFSPAKWIVEEGVIFFSKPA